ncbi:PBECR2 nuclease fold domain-containing protein [Helicobacter sp. MIT 05-5294]|uniref:PBECR2 nuclease fold domain-containing protein n=1 Tax=Helicobacter sp. MIT 05-5294 TaxID=1548150 RepID=UPI00188463C0|nr:PBECR2 nuclease fold domain-containing protein [Helicobacter sp. MIT 05-5294]
MQAVDFKTHARVDFDKFESLGGKKEYLLEHLKNLDTDLKWEQLEALPLEQQYDYLKNNPFNINVNNPSKNIDTLYSPQYKENLAKQSLKKYEFERANQSLGQDIKDFASSALEYATGYENENIQERKARLNEVQQTASQANLTSDKLKGLGLKGYSNEVATLQRGYSNVIDAFTDRFTQKSGVEKAHDQKVNAYQALQQHGSKSYAELDEQEKQQVMPLVKESLGIVSRLFRDDKEQWEFFKDLTRAQEYVQDFSAMSRKLENILPSQQFLHELWSSESLSEKQTQALKDYEIVAEKMGFDALAYNQHGLYFIKQGKVFKVDENFNTMVNNAIKDNIGSISLGIAGAIAGSKKGLKGAIAGGALGGFAGGISDAVLTDLVLERDVSIPELLLHGSQEASFNIAGDLAFAGIGAVVKGVKNSSFFKLKPDDTQEGMKKIFTKISASLQGQNVGAIDRILKEHGTKQSRSDNLERFLSTQSENVIRDDFKENTLINSLISKAREYLPLNKLDSLSAKDETVKGKQQELLANVLKNKDLADALAGQLDDVEARILSQAMNKMAKDFKALSGDYEKLIAKEVLKNETNPSLPKVFQALVSQAENEVKNNYKKAVGELQNALEGERLDLLTPFKQMADIAITDFGINSDISKLLINEVKNLEGRNITIKEALEKRKDINQILKNFNDNPNTLKKFRVDESMAMLKDAIDTTIHNAIEKKIAKMQMSKMSEAKNALEKINIDTLNEEQKQKELFKEANALLSPTGEPLTRPFSTGINLDSNRTLASDIIPQSTKLDKHEVLNNLSHYLRPQTTLPKEIDIDAFLTQLANFENKENFIKHLQSRNDAKNRMAYLHLVEPTFKEPNLILSFKDGKKEYIKSFQTDKGDIKYLLVTRDNDRLLITGIPNVDEKYLRGQVTHADLIQTFIPQEQQAKSGLLKDIIPQSTKLDKQAEIFDTIVTQAVDNYAQSAEFKALSADKQRAILSLKYIQPEQMPMGVKIKDLENLKTHFADKADREQREEFLKLFKTTKEKPDLVLEISRNGELRQEYIKAFQHKENKNLYYLAITQDEINITGIPTTQVKKVINDIVRSERILNAESLQGILNPADLVNKTQSPAVSKDIIPQQAQDLRQILENFKKANIDYADMKHRLNDKLTKAIFMDKPKKSTINSMRSVEEWKKAVLDKQWVDSIQGLENTIFAKFNPRMQEATQTLLIFRALERHIKENDGASMINLTKALKDIAELEKLPLHPQAQNALNIFKELASVYQFAHKIAGAKGFKSGAGNGALSTSLEGRAKVFLVNKLFRNLFFRVPHIGDKDAVLFHLKRAVQELKYPRAITLDMLNNPKLTHPQPPTPSNPSGDVFITESMAKDIQDLANDEHMMLGELEQKIGALRGENKFIKELSNGDKIFKDASGKTHKLSNEVQEQWLKTFNLKSLDEDFIPHFSPEVKKALGDKKVKLTQGSLLKLSAKNRTQYIPQIKETLENPDKIISHQGNVIFAREIDDKKYFTSVGKDFDTHITIVSNAPKKTNNLENKMFDGGEVIYQSTKFENLRYNQTFTEQRLMPNKIDNDIISQNAEKSKMLLEALEEDRVIYTKVGSGRLESQDIEELKNILREDLSQTQGFKGGEVAGASDILKSGGTYSKPSDLQIEYPANQVSGKNPTDIIPQKVFDMSEVNFNTLDDFVYYANLVGIDFKNLPQAKEAYQYILEHLKELEC